MIGISVAKLLFELQGTFVRPISYEYFGSQDVKSMLVNRISHTIERVIPNTLFYLCPTNKNAVLNDSRFLDNLISKGVILLVAEKTIDMTKIIQSKKVAVLLVDYMPQFFQRFNSLWFSQFNFLKIAVTGSNGKTSTSTMLEFIFSQKYVTKRPVSYLTEPCCEIHDMDENCEIAIIEASGGSPYTPEYNGYILRPDVVVFTNIDWVHIKNWPKPHSLEQIIAGKIGILQYLKQTGLVYVNGNYPAFANVCVKPLQRVRKYGLTPDMDYYASDIQYNDDLTTDFELHSQNQSIHIHLPVPGEKMVLAAVAASAVAHDAGFSLEDIRRGIDMFSPWENRLKVGRDAITLIDDAYNASPESVMAAVDMLTSHLPDKRKVMIFGGMAELDDQSDRLHGEIGKYINDKAIDIVITVGEDANITAKNIDTVRHRDRTVLSFDNKEDAEATLSQILNDGDVVLLKASRCYELETLGDLIKNKYKLNTCICAADHLCVHDLSRDKILIGRNMDTPFVPVSNVKLCLAAYVIENYDIEKAIHIDEKLAAICQLEYGEFIKIKDALTAIIIASRNDLCNLLMHYFSNNEQYFLDNLNSWLKLQGMANTNFFDCSGCSNNNVTTLTDLSQIFKKLFTNPVFITIIDKYEHIINTGRRKINIKNNNIIKNPQLKYYSPYAIGGSSGLLIKNVENISINTHNFTNLYVCQGHEILITIGNLTIKLPKLYKGLITRNDLKFINANAIFKSIMSSEYGINIV